MNGFLFTFPRLSDQWSALKDPHIFKNAARKLGRLTHRPVICSRTTSTVYVILSTSELLRAQEGQTEQTRTGAELIERNARRASKIVKTLLDFSRSGMCRLEPYSVADAAEYSLELIDSSLKAAKVRVEKNFEKAPKVFLDPQYMHSVIYNLVNNAAQALEGAADGYVKISSGWLEAEQEVFLTISDNGPGLEPAMLENLFQPFLPHEGQRRFPPPDYGRARRVDNRGLLPRRRGPGKPALQEDGVGIRESEIENRESKIEDREEAK